MTTNTVNQQDLLDRLHHAHVRLMRSPATSLYAGVITMGKVTFDESVPTACTNGVDVMYGAEFMAKQNPAQTRFVVMHENLHKLLRHCSRHRDLWEQDSRTANQAADFVVNGIIMDDINDPELFQMPTIPPLHNKKYQGWSFSEVYNDLRQAKQEQGGSDDLFGDPMDGHDRSLSDEMTPEQAEKLDREITRMIQESGILAGRLGADLPRTVLESDAPEINWAKETEEFVTTQVQGRDDDVSYRRLNRRWLAHDVIMPDTISESVEEIAVFIDTSGSIDDKALSEFGQHIAHIAENVSPERVRVGWWDHEVHGEQIFEAADFASIRTLLKPVGGGGTRVSSVSDYLVKNHIKPDCLIVMTDGYVEQDIDWRVESPTLWVVTQSRSFTPPVGRVVKMN